jgi:hypothetical protein
MKHMTRILGMLSLLALSLLWVVPQGGTQVACFGQGVDPAILGGAGNDTFNGT